MDHRPRVVLVTGAPGTGKTTLARSLAHELRVPFLGRDDVRGGLALSAGAWNGRLRELPSAAAATARFVELVEAMLASGVSCVIELVVRRQQSDVLARVLAAGDCVVLLTECDQGLARFERRHRTERLIARPEVLAASGHGTVAEHTAAAVERMRAVPLQMPDELPVPCLGVDTSDGSDPGLDDIVAFAVRGS